MTHDSHGSRFEEIRNELYTAVVSDVLDAKGLRHQALQAGIVPLVAARRMVGRAYPVLVAETFTLPERPYATLIEALDAIGDHEVFVSNALSDRAAFWGELLSYSCRMRGAAGAVIDGLVRDVERIEPLDFPVFGRGRLPVDSMGRFEVVSYCVPVECGGVTIMPGDLIVADSDGIVVVPQGIEAAVLDEALNKVRGENAVRDGLEAGKLLRELFDTYGVL